MLAFVWDNLHVQILCMLSSGLQVTLFTGTALFTTVLSRAGWFSKIIEGCVTGLSSVMSASLLLLPNPPSGCEVPAALAETVIEDELQATLRICAAGLKLPMASYVQLLLQCPLPVTKLSTVQPPIFTLFPFPQLTLTYPGGSVTPL